MPRFEELPDLPPLTPFLLAALVLTFWLAVRIGILRRRRERRGSGDEAGITWGWLEALAAKPWIRPALAVVALVLAAATAATFLLQ